MLDVRRNPPLDAPLVDALIEMWVAVTNAGGAVGFVAPTTAEIVRPLAMESFDRVRSGEDDLAVAFLDSEPVAFGFLVPNTFSLTSHWGTIKRLQRHPGRAGAGVGAAVLADLEDAARARGLQRVVLTVRGGTDRERFYQAQGYAVDALLPGRLQLAEGVIVDEYHLSKRLDGADEPSPGTRLEVTRLDPDLPLPRYAHPGDAGLDLHAAEEVQLAAGERAVVPTGVAIALPVGHVGLVHPRSGLAARHGIALVNAPGTIDAGFRGEVKVILVNLDPAQPVHIARGDRIAQLVIQRVERPVVVEVDELPVSLRGEGGFGSTGR